MRIDCPHCGEFHSVINGKCDECGRLACCTYSEPDPLRYHPGANDSAFRWQIEKREAEKKNAA